MAPVPLLEGPGQRNRERKVVMCHIRLPMGRLGAMLFGLVYVYLAQVHSEIILRSGFLRVVGFLMIGGFVVLAKRYWFITPLAGSSVSLVLYVLGIVAARSA